MVSTKDTVKYASLSNVNPHTEISKGSEAAISNISCHADFMFSWPQAEADPSRSTVRDTETISLHENSSPQSNFVHETVLLHRA